MKLLILAFLSTPTLGQYDLGMKPDVTFGDHNDRFDLTSLMQDQNTYLDKSEEFRRRGGRRQNAYDDRIQNHLDMSKEFKTNGGIMQNTYNVNDKLMTHNGRRQKTYIDKSEEFRRYQSEVERKKSETGSPIFIIRRNDNGYRYKDPSGENIDLQETLIKYQEKRRFQKLVAHLHGLEGGRRSNVELEVATTDPEKEILMHHAFPVNITIDGFLKVPFVM